MGRVRDHRFKDFSRVGERFIDGALTNRADLNEVLFGIEKNDPERFAIEEAPFRNKGLRLPKDYRWKKNCLRSWRDIWD